MLHHVNNALSCKHVTIIQSQTLEWNCLFHPSYSKPIDSSDKTISAWLDSFVSRHASTNMYACIASLFSMFKLGIKNWPRIINHHAWFYLDLAIVIFNLFSPLHPFSTVQSMDGRIYCSCSFLQEFINYFWDRLLCVTLTLVLILTFVLV